MPEMLPDYDILGEITDRKIDMLRKLDSIIDFSRSSYQLDIIILLGKSSKPMDPGSIASSLGIPRKQILDALRKLKLKGLIDVTGSGSYTLTKTGVEFFNKLMDLINRSDTDSRNNNSNSTNGNRARVTSKTLASLSISSRISMLINTIYLLNKPITLEKAS
jgi:DNA-binding PadR family transcriptional regulator